MDAELKTKWVKALRSGDYTQGKGILKHNDTFCCLGVLMDIQGCDWLGVKEINLISSYLDDEFKAGLTATDTVLLAHMNDDGNSTFAEIANYIEENF